MSHHWLAPSLLGSLPARTAAPGTDDDWRHYGRATLAAGPCRKRSLGLPWLNAGQLPETVGAEPAVAFIALMPGETKHPARPSATYAPNHAGTSILPTRAARTWGRPSRESSENRRASERGRRIAQTDRPPARRLPAGAARAARVSRPPSDLENRCLPGAVTSFSQFALAAAIALCSGRGPGVVGILIAPAGGA